MNLLLRSTTTWTYAIVLFRSTLHTTCYAQQWQPPVSLVRSWSSKQIVTFRSTDSNDHYFFMKDTITVTMVITPDGSVEGYIGDAHFAQCRISKNRGWFGRFLGLWTDFVVDGRLTGKISNKGPFFGREIRSPFDLEDGRIKGSVFHLESFDAFPMINFQLSKQ